MRAGALTARPPGNAVYMVSCLFTCQVMADLRPHGLLPSRPLCPGVSPGKNTGMRCHFLFPGDPPSPGIAPLSPASAGGFFTPEPAGKPMFYALYRNKPSTTLAGLEGEF